jgi:hypothetical protein
MEAEVVALVVGVEAADPHAEAQRATNTMAATFLIDEI